MASITPNPVPPEHPPPSSSSMPIPKPILTLPPSIVRPYHPTDNTSSTLAANNPNVTRFLTNAFPSPYTLSDANTWIAHCLSQSPPQNWAIVHPTTGAVMGGIGIRPETDIRSLGAEMGWWLGEEYWGRGVMSAVVCAFVVWVFSEYRDGQRIRGLERLSARVVEGNGASVRVGLKAGLRREGRMRRAVWKEGKFADEVLYAIVREDWEQERRRREETDMAD